MQNMLPKKFQDRLIVIPSHLQFSSSTKSLKYAELLGAVDLMDKEKAITFDKNEFHREYGAHGIVGLRQTAKKTNFPHILRVVDDGKKIIIFKNDRIQPVKKL